MSVTAGTDKNFEEIITQNDVVIIDFWAPWCGPCRAFAPTFEDASKRHADVKFVKVNTDEEQALAREFQIQAIPTLMVFREQVLIVAHSGMLPAAAVDEVLGKVKALDMAQVKKELEAQESN